MRPTPTGRDSHCGPTGSEALIVFNQKSPRKATRGSVRAEARRSNRGAYGSKHAYLIKDTQLLLEHLMLTRIKTQTNNIKEN
jgi:hypothetical protein